MFFLLASLDPVSDRDPRARKPPPNGAAARPQFSAVYAEHAAFMWRSLRRLGVADKDVEDACQEAFLVAHKKLDQFIEGSMRAWLFAIATRVASDYRKRAHVRREVLAAEPPPLTEEEKQTGAIDRERALLWLDAVIARLDDDKRAVFILFELEELPMAEVALAVGCPLQTAYSRLHAARTQIATAIQREQAKERGQA